MATTTTGLEMISSTMMNGWLVFNDLLYAIEALTTIKGVLDKDVSNPSGLSLNEGDLYIVKQPGAGLWTNQNNKIAQVKNSSWYFYEAPVGCIKYIIDEGILVVKKTTGWESLA